jgi:hypothetical protein
MLVLADAARDAYDLSRYQMGMVFIGVVVVVLMLLFRRLFRDDDAPAPKKNEPPQH